MYDKIHMKAVLKLLKTSVDSKLNASLTPEDCALVLKTLENAYRATSGAIRMAKESPPPPPAPAPAPSRENPIDRIVEGLADLGKNIIEDLTDDFRTPKRRKRR